MKKTTEAKPITEEICSAEKLIKSAGLKSTKQRLLVLDEILYTVEPFTAGQLHLKLSNSMDLTTIYRILSVLKASGIIRELSSMDENHFYELACVHHPVHPHFFCKECGAIECLEPLPEEKLSSLLADFRDHMIKQISLDLQGVCVSCRSSGKFSHQ